MGTDKRENEGDKGRVTKYMLERLVYLPHIKKEKPKPAPSESAM